MGDNKCNIREKHIQTNILPLAVEKKRIDTLVKAR